MTRKIKVQPLVMAVSDADLSLCLKAEKNQNWFDAIISNNITTIESILEQCDPEQKGKYLNGYFEFTKNKLPVKDVLAI